MSSKKRRTESEDESEGSFEASSGEETEDLNSNSDNEDDEEDDEEEEEDEEEEKESVKKIEEDAKPNITISDLLERKKGKMVSMNYCSSHPYTGPIENIKDLLNGSANNEIDIKEDAPDSNEPVFKNVTKKWGWKQELMLLEGVEERGFFNWESIAQQLSEQSGKIFKADEAQNHYFQYYCNGTLGQVWNHQLEKTQFECFDHTDPIRSSSTKYLPKVSWKNLKEIKFLPHREDFEEYPLDEIEQMVTSVDFSSFYINNLKALKIDQEVRSLQLVIVDAYRKVVADRMKMHKLMKDFKLIEQFFFNMQRKNIKQCEIDRHFTAMQKFVSFFHSPNEFNKFYFDCVKEKVLKLEIARLYQVLATKKKKAQDPKVKVMLDKKAPGCFSTLTKILYCTGLTRERKNSCLQKEKKQDEILICIFPTIIEGIRMKCKRMELEKSNSVFLE